MDIHKGRSHHSFYDFAWGGLRVSCGIRTDVTAICRPVPRRVRPAYQRSNPTCEFSLRTGRQTRLPVDRIETGGESGADEWVVAKRADVRNRVTI